MQAQRIILANESRLLREMLHRVIVKTPDLEVVGDTDELGDLPSLIQQTSAHWVIVPLLSDNSLSPDVERVLIQEPNVHVLAVAVDGSRLIAKWMEPRESELGDISLEELLAILRNEQGYPNQTHA